MDNLALYRKYRPQSFSEIIGQEHVVRTLANSIISKTVSHAYLFSGPRGSGKTTIARLFAKAINCRNLKAASAEPCNKCDSCLEIMAGNSMDLAEIDAASHTQVDKMRELTESVKFSPVKSKYKIFIIDECHQLSKSAANALLKTLEEPPPHAIFILATTEADKMIPTIVSRCQRFDFKRLQPSEIIKKLEFILKKEEIKFDQSVLPIIALNARGSFRDAESILDKCVNFLGHDGKITADEIKEMLGVVEAEQMRQMADFIVRQQGKEAILFLNSMFENGADLHEFAKTFVFYLRQILLLKIEESLVSPQNVGMSGEEIEKMKKLAAALSESRIKKMLEAFIGAENKMKYAAVPQLPLEMAIIELTIYEE